jgi:penicillin-binding protein 1A
MMQDVVRYGTAASAGQLGRSDLAGKTGTTNDARDTWFAGFNPGLVAIAWMGYDQPHSLGRGETGAHSALPIWINFMGSALKGVPQQGWPMPPGIITVKINPDTGTRVSDSPVSEFLGSVFGIASPAMEEHFYQEFPPPDTSAAGAPGEPENPEPTGAPAAAPGSPL